MRFPVDRSIAPFVTLSMALGLVGYVGDSRLVVGVAVVATVFFMYFFRDPDRTVAQVDNEVLAAADGRVVEAGSADGPDGRRWEVVRVFLSPFDVHVNRVSVSGQVRRVTYVKGQFRPTWFKGALSSNSHNDLWIRSGNHDVVLRQIAGIVVRRIECRLVVGQDVVAGSRYGIMKFGSRLDVFLPEGSTLSVTPGQRVSAGRSVIGCLPPS